VQETPTRGLERGDATTVAFPRKPVAVPFEAVAFETELERHRQHEVDPVRRNDVLRGLGIDAVLA